MNIRDKIIAADDIGTEIVPVPQWDVTVEARGLTLGQRNAAIAATRDENQNLDISEYYAAVIIATVMDPETHEPVFTFADVKEILAKASGPTDMLAKKALELSGLSERGDVGEAVEEAGKESSETETAD